MQLPLFDHVVVVVLPRAASRVLPNSLPLNHSRSTDVRNAYCSGRDEREPIGVGWRRSRVPVYHFRGKIRRGRGSSTKAGLRFLRRRFRLDFGRETPNGDPFRVTAHRTGEDEYRFQGRGPWRCRYRSRTGWGPPLVGPYIATTTTVRDRVPSFSSLSIAARVDRTSADPGTYVSKPLRHLVFWNTPIICRRDGHYNPTGRGSGASERYHSTLHSSRYQIWLNDCSLWLHSRYQSYCIILLL